MAVKEENRLLTTGEVCDIIGVCHTTLFNYIEKGLIKPDVMMATTKNGKRGRRKFKPETVTNFVRRHWASTNHYNGEKLMTTGDIVVYLGLSRNAIYNHILKRRLEPDMILPEQKNGSSGCRRFLRDTVDDFADRYGYKVGGSNGRAR